MHGVCSAAWSPGTKFRRAAGLENEPLGLIFYNVKERRGACTFHTCCLYTRFGIIATNEGAPNLDLQVKLMSRPHAGSCISHTSATGMASPQPSRPCHIPEDSAKLDGLTEPFESDWAIAHVVFRLIHFDPQLGNDRL